jgi:DNA repair protein RecO (recombination protein O)
MLGPGRTIETEALVIKRTQYADADWIVTLFTSHLGKVSALAARARQTRHRFAGGLEAFHNLTVQLRSTRSEELLQLTDASITRARHGLASHLLAMQTAGRALNWLRRALPSRTVEPQAWLLVQNWLDIVDSNPPGTRPLSDARLAEFGLQFLTVLGWSLEMSKCVRCGKPCPPQSSAYVNPSQGGVVCRACGGTGQLVNSSLRRQMELLSNLGTGELFAEDSRVALGVVERTLECHAGID